MKMKMNSSVQGAPKVTTLEASGRYLGADCGGIKPMTLPKQ